MLAFKIKNDSEDLIKIFNYKENVIFRWFIDFLSFAYSKEFSCSSNIFSMQNLQSRFYFRSPNLVESAFSFCYYHLVPKNLISV